MMMRIVVYMTILAPVLDVFDRAVARYAVNCEPCFVLPEDRWLQWGRDGEVRYFHVKLPSIEWRRASLYQRLYGGGAEYSWQQRVLTWTSSHGWFMDYRQVAS